MKKQAKQWLINSEYDLEVAKSLFQAGHYRYVIFMTHLSLEKALKSYIAENMTGFPPYIHNLAKLVEIAGLVMPIQIKSFIYQASDESVPTRYPGNERIYTKAKAVKYIQHTEKVLAWLRRELKLEK